MTLHEDVASINDGDRVTAEVRHFGTQYEITGPAQMGAAALTLGPFTIAYVGDDGGGMRPGVNLLRIVSRVPKPAPLYANRPDITEPRKYDVVLRGAYSVPATYHDGRWRGHGGSYWTTEDLLAAGPLTLVGEAIQ